MREHRPNRANDEHDINPPHPPIDLLAEVGADLGGSRIDVHFALHEILTRTRVAFATSLKQPGFVDGRSRITRREDFMNTVATATVGGEG